MNTKQQLCFCFVLMCVVALHASRDYVSKLTVSNGQRWGKWGAKEFCPESQFAYAYSMKIQRKKLKGDDSSLNGIRLYCRTPMTTGLLSSNSITSTVGPWGNWKETKKCGATGEFLTSFSLQVQSNQGSGDDTAENFIKFKCRSRFGETYKLSQLPGHGFWGQLVPVVPAVQIGRLFVG